MVRLLRPPNIVRISGRGEPVFRDDPRWVELSRRFSGLDAGTHGPRAIVVVRAELIRDTCGFAVPLLTYEGDRDLHAKRFAREDDESLARYFEGKEHIGDEPGRPSRPAAAPAADARTGRLIRR